MNIKLMLVFVLFLLASCSRTIELDSTIMEPQLVLSAVIEAGKSDSLLLSTNYLSTQYQPNTRIGGASITVNSEGNTIGSYTEEAIGRYRYTGERFEEGKTYTLQAKAENYPEVSSTITIPKPPAFRIISMERTKDENKQWRNQRLSVTIEIDDPEGTNEYYMIEAKSSYLSREYVLSEDSNYYHTVMVKRMAKSTIDSKSPVIDVVDNDGFYAFAQNEVSNEVYTTIYPSTLFFSDKLFNGEKKTITLGATLFNNNSEKDLYFHVTISAISPEYYQLVRSLAAYRKSENGMFSDALQMYGNIENGLGYWVAKTPRTDSIQFKSNTNETK